MSEADDAPSPARRLRDLEYSGDPDVRDVARKYKTSPLEPTAPAMRSITRSINRTTDMLRPSYSGASKADADEAEERAAEVRANRQKRAQQREEDLYAFATAADRREKSMLRLTQASVVVAFISLAIAVAALLVAVL